MPSNYPRGPLVWFSAVCGVMMLWGVYFALFGFNAFPIDKAVLPHWQSAIYGAIMIGWGLTLLLVGGIALRQQDALLMKVVLAGLAVWLVIEGLFSIYLKVWFNAGVDLAVLILFALPLIMALRRAGNRRTQ